MSDLTVEIRERLVRVETKLDILLTMREDLSELEKRVRHLETGWAKLLGVAAAVSGVVGALFSFLPTIWKH